LLKIPTFVLREYFSNFFFYEISKFRDKAERNIYNFQFRKTKRKPLWVVFSLGTKLTH